MIKILHLEDDKNDAELIEAVILAAKIDSSIKVVEGRDDYKSELAKGNYDLIISDFQLPSFDGITALSMANKALADTPFIFVSGAMGEEAAIDALTRGASDYVLKTNLSRLPYAINRVLSEKQIRLANKNLEAEIRLNESKIKLMYEKMQTGIIIIDPENHTIVDANDIALNVIGTTLKKIVGKECHKFICPAEKGKCPIIDLEQKIDKSERFLINVKGESVKILKTAGIFNINGKKYLIETFVNVDNNYID